MSERLTNYERCICLEDPLADAYKELQFSVTRNHQTGKGCDFYTDNSENEAKNVKDCIYVNDPEWFMSHVCDRYAKAMPLIGVLANSSRRRILTISFNDITNPIVLDYIAYFNIHILEVGEQVGKDKAQQRKVKNILKQKILALYMPLEKREKCGVANSQDAYEEWREHQFGDAFDHALSIQREYEREFLYLS